MNNATRTTRQEIAATRPSTAAAMERAGIVAEITYNFRGGWFIKNEREDGTFTNPQRVA